MSDWSFHNPVRIHAAPGSLGRLPGLLDHCRSVLLVISPGFRGRGGLARVERLLEGRALHVVDDIAPNPDVAHVERQIENLVATPIDAVVGIGGGSVLDTAKIIAVALERDSFSLRRHLSAGGQLPPMRRNRLICIPTTAGTGSEVTPFATVWDSATYTKHSVAGDALFPDDALLDAELTLTMPEDVTLSTGLDAITQAFESTWSRRGNGVSTALAVRAIRIGLETLPRLTERPGDLELRSAMLDAGVLAGLAISQSRTALCHSISYPITVHFGVPHGFACAFTLPEVFAFNAEADEGRFAEVAAAVGSDSVDDLLQRLRRLLTESGIAVRMRRYVGNGAGLSALASEMLTPGRADNNWRAATVEDVSRIVEEAVRARRLAS
jgi:phosphonate metabolism-associated iron-containing alcohol dehydrogenase